MYMGIQLPIRKHRKKERDKGVSDITLYV